MDFITTGSNTVETGYPRFVAADEPGPDGTATGAGRVFIDPVQAFVGVPDAAWTFVVGGHPRPDGRRRHRRRRLRLGRRPPLL